MEGLNLAFLAQGPSPQWIGLALTGSLKLTLLNPTNE